MNEYKKFLLENSQYLKIKESETELKLNRNIILAPFKFLEQENGLEWWGSYNNVKHHRVKDNNFTKANLHNILLSLCALYFLECFYYNVNYYNVGDNSRYSVPRPKSKLFDSINNITDNIIDNLEFEKIDEW